MGRGRLCVDHLTCAKVHLAQQGPSGITQSRGMERGRRRRRDRRERDRLREGDQQRGKKIKTD